MPDQDSHNNNGVGSICWFWQTAGSSTIHVGDVIHSWMAQWLSDEVHPTILHMHRITTESATRTLHHDVGLQRIMLTSHHAAMSSINCLNI